MGIEVSTLTVEKNKKYCIHLFIDNKKYSCLGVGNTKTEVMENALKKIFIIEKVLKNAKETLTKMLG